MCVFIYLFFFPKTDATDRIIIATNLKFLTQSNQVFDINVKKKKTNKAPKHRILMIFP